MADLNDINSFLKQASSLDDISKIRSTATEAINERLAFYGTQLGSEIGEIIGGFEALTDGNDAINLPEEFRNIVVGAITPNVPDVQDILTTVIGGDETDLNAITGGGIVDGALNEVFGAVTPSAINDALTEVTGKGQEEIQNALEAVSPDQVTQYVSSAISNIVPGITSTLFNSELGGFISSLSSTLSNFASLSSLLDDFIDSNPITRSNILKLGVSNNYTIIGSKQELEAEFRATSRDITEVMFHWTRHYSDQGLIGVEDIEAQDNRLKYHLVIRKDGTIQRGLEMYKVADHTQNRDQYSISVAFVGGYNCPTGTSNSDFYLASESLTNAQLKSFQLLMSAYFTVWPGGQAFGLNEVEADQIEPGFSVSRYVKTKFNKDNIQIGFDLASLSPTELIQSRG